MEYLPSIIPELKLRSLYMDRPHGSEPPEADGYIVSIGRKTQKVGSVYQIASVRAVVPRAPRSFVRYQMQVIKLPELVDKVKYFRKGECAMVNGQWAITLFWYPREKRKR
jgi:hypothetical protein